MSLRFKLDENVPDGLTTELTTLGHDAATCQQEGIAGTGDAAIAAYAATEGRILVTFDLDFSDMRRFPPGTPALWSSACTARTSKPAGVPSPDSCKASRTQLFVVISSWSKTRACASDDPDYRRGPPVRRTTCQPDCSFLEF